MDNSRLNNAVLQDNLLKPDTNNNPNINQFHLVKLFILNPDDTWPLLLHSPEICSDFACTLCFLIYLLSCPFIYLF